jgi:hypothetical protein
MVQVPARNEDKTRFLTCRLSIMQKNKEEFVQRRGF